MVHHKKPAKTLSNSCLVRGLPHLHAKFIISDPSTNPKGLLLTSNVTQEALTRNPEFAYILDPLEIGDLFEAFRFAFWNDANQELQEQKWAGVKKKQVSIGSWKQIISSIKNVNNLEHELIKLI